MIRMKAPAPVDVSTAVKRLLEEESGSGTPTRGKRVSFGPYVSPEYFDKALPPSTPVRKVGVLLYVFPEFIVTINNYCTGKVKGNYLRLGISFARPLSGVSRYM